MRHTVYGPVAVKGKRRAEAAPDCLDLHGESEG